MIRKSVMPNALFALISVMLNDNCHLIWSIFKISKNRNSWDFVFAETFVIFLLQVNAFCVQYSHLRSSLTSFLSLWYVSEGDLRSSGLETCEICRSQALHQSYSDLMGKILEYKPTARKRRYVQGVLKHRADNTFDHVNKPGGRHKHVIFKTRNTNKV